MKLGHLHAGVVDLEAAVRWMERVWGIQAKFRNGGMAAFDLGSAGLVLDAADADAVVTIAFESDSCDEDFRQVTGRGARGMEPPADRPWGVRVAYIEGPGKLTFEIEEAKR